MDMNKHPFGTMPVLEIGEGPTKYVLHGSNCILHYVSGLVGWKPANPLMDARVLEVYPPFPYIIIIIISLDLALSGAELTHVLCR